MTKYNIQNLLKIMGNQKLWQCRAKLKGLQKMHSSLLLGIHVIFQISFSTSKSYAKLDGIKEKRGKKRKRYFD